MKPGIFGMAVLKYRFDYYSGMGGQQIRRPIEKIVCYSQFPRGGGTPCQAGPQGKHQRGSGGREREGRMWAGPVTVFAVVPAGRNRPGRGSWGSKFRIDEFE